MSKRNNFSIIRKVGAFAMCLSFVAILAQSAYASANIRNMPTRNLGAMQQTAGTTQTTTGAAQGAATVRAATTARATAGAGTGG
ncbi:MAG: hypothetical protein FWC83_02130, partial [Alphaproteobacteria bacterium]|nr:hypothetical protein [Alphaproteobacteria bacterium]